MIFPIATASFEFTINQLLRLNPESAEQMQALNNKVILLELTDLNTQLYFLPNQKEVQILSHYEGEADCVVKGTSFSLFKIGISQADSGPADVIEISGDIDIGQQFQAVIAEFEIDWEEHWSKVIGDAGAHQLGNLFRKAKHIFSDSIQTLNMDVSEYLHFEVEKLPLKEDVDNFIRTVKETEAAVDQLANRIELIKERQNKTK